MIVEFRTLPVESIVVAPAEKTALSSSDTDRRIPMTLRVPTRPALALPSLVLVLGLTQVHAEATSLLAIIPTVVVGA